VNPSNAPAPLWLETPASSVECEATGFARIELDESRGLVTIDAAGPIAPIRLRGAASLRMVLNGADVSDQMRLTGDDIYEYATA
jgi:hypothetical protein